MSKESLNIIVPIYNPHVGWEDQFTDSLIKLRAELKETEFSVILVNDGSTHGIDNIEKIQNQFNFLKYCTYPVNMGKGYAIRFGIKISDADYYIYTDMDFPFGFQSVSLTYQMLRSSDINIVVGTRDISYFKMLPLNRRIYSFILKELNYFITGFKIKDTQAGLKGLDNKAKSVLISTKTNTFLFELEFLRNSLKQGLKYNLIDIKCRPGLHFTNFKFRILFKETMSFMKILFKIGKKNTTDI